MDGLPALSRAYRRLRRTVLARRRSLAALCAALAVLTAVQANARPPAPTTTVLVAAHDLPAGVPVDRADLAAREFRPGSVPSGTVTAAEAVGRTTVGPIREGEPVTDVRLLRGSLLDGYPGMVAAPVRIGDAGAVRLLRVGDRVDVLAADPRAGTAKVLTTDAPVIAVPRDSRDALGVVTGALVVLAVSDATARTFAGAAGSSYLSVVIAR
jgi:Flp pilus assembly protein CpaB